MSDPLVKDPSISLKRNLRYWQKMYNLLMIIKAEI